MHGERNRSWHSARWFVTKTNLIVNPRSAGWIGGPSLSGRDAEIPYRSVSLNATCALFSKLGLTSGFKSHFEGSYPGGETFEANFDDVEALTAAIKGVYEVGIQTFGNTVTTLKFCTVKSQWMPRKQAEYSISAGVLSIVAISLVSKANRKSMVSRHF